MDPHALQNYPETFSKIKLDDPAKSLVKRHPGESRGPELLEKMDSGFRRNDEFYGISTFYKISNFLTEAFCFSVPEVV